MGPSTYLNIYVTYAYTLCVHIEQLAAVRKRQSVYGRETLPSHGNRSSLSMHRLRNPMHYC